MKPCIILGNGPSANDLPEHPGMPIFGCNYAPVQPDFYICVDTMILTLHAESIYPLACAAKISYLSAKHEGSSKLYDLPYVRLVDHDTGPFKSEQFFTGCTATYVALKMAYYAGFDTVHLWGVDHSADWKHYKRDYYIGDADRRPWRMKQMENHYTLAANVYARAGRTIINHSNPSKLDMIFCRAK
jgi:hypothetical protein